MASYPPVPTFGPWQAGVKVSLRSQSCLSFGSLRGVVQSSSVQGDEAICGSDVDTSLPGANCVGGVCPYTTLLDCAALICGLSCTLTLLQQVTVDMLAIRRREGKLDDIVYAVPLFLHCNPAHPMCTSEY